MARPSRRWCRTSRTTRCAHTIPQSCAQGRRRRSQVCVHGRVQLHSRAFSAGAPCACAQEVALSDTESFGGRDEPPNVKGASHARHDPGAFATRTEHHSPCLCTPQRARTTQMPPSSSHTTTSCRRGARLPTTPPRRRAARRRLRRARSPAPQPRRGRRRGQAGWRACSRKPATREAPVVAQEVPEVRRGRSSPPGALPSSHQQDWAGLTRSFVAQGWMVALPWWWWWLQRSLARTTPWTSSTCTSTTTSRRSSSTLAGGAFVVRGCASCSCGTTDGSARRRGPPGPERCGRPSHERPSSAERGCWACARWCVWGRRYKPQNIELETKLKPFIPDYIPAVGGLDEFIKVPRPDGKSDFLGLKVRTSGVHLWRLQHGARALSSGGREGVNRRAKERNRKGARPPRASAVVAGGGQRAQQRGG